MFIGGVFNTFYEGGLSYLPKPGKYQLKLSKGKITIQSTSSLSTKLVLPVSSIQSASVSYITQDKQFSAGKAIAGGILAGGVGAIAGAAMGGKKVVPSLHLTFTDTGNNSHELILICSKAEDAEKMMRKKYKLS